MPKRSTGCFNCRSRKVRCDEGRPECNNCLRRGTKCPGYRPTQAFILHTFDESERPATIKEDENRYKYAPRNENQVSVGRQAVEAWQSNIQVSDCWRPVSQTVSPVAIEREQYLGSFLDLYLPPWASEALTPPSALILSLPSRPASHKVFLSALDALASAQIAVDRRDSLLVNRSRSLYGTALSHLMKSIMRTNSPVPDEVLIGTYLLSLYEIFIGVNAGPGFLNHVQGLLRLFIHRGPSTINTPLSFNTFLSFRYHALVIGCILREGSILDTPEWLEVTAEAAKTDTWVSLLDICICIPRILERIDKLKRLGAPLEEFQTLIADAQGLAERSSAWFANYERHGPHYWRVTIDSVKGFRIGDCPFEPIFSFDTWGASATYLLYFMSMLILRSNIFLLEREYGNLESKELRALDAEMHGYAANICRSVPHSSRATAGYTGRFSVLTPLTIARKYFEAKGAQKEVNWCEKVYYSMEVPGLYASLQIDYVSDEIKMARKGER